MFYIGVIVVLLVGGLQQTITYEPFRTEADCYSVLTAAANGMRSTGVITKFVSMECKQKEGGA